MPNTPNGRVATRSWRTIAKELACEVDPAKARLLLDELNRVIHFVRYEDSDTGPLSVFAKLHPKP